MRFCLMSLTFALFPLAVGNAQEPNEVGGKSFQEWMKLMKDRDPANREDAMKNVLLFGPAKSHEALPEIIFQLNRHKPGRPIDLSVRVNGIMALSTIFKQMAMVKKDPDPKVQKEALALYKKFLQDDQVLMRVRTVQGLPFLGPIARDAMDDVIKLAQDLTITWEVRKEALITLTTLAPDAKGAPHPKALPALHRALDKENEIAYPVRQMAAQALAALSRGKMPPELFKALENDPAVQVRLTVLDLIANLSYDMDALDRPPAIRKLKKHLLVEPNPIVKIWTHMAIMTLAKNLDKAHMESIVAEVKHKDPAVGVQALTAIGQVGALAKPIALPAVLGALTDADASVAVAAMNAAIRLKAIEAIPILEKIKSDKKAPELLREAAGRALAELEKLVPAEKEKKHEDKKTPPKK